MYPGMVYVDAEVESATAPSGDDVDVEASAAMRTALTWGVTCAMQSGWCGVSPQTHRSTHRWPPRPVRSAAGGRARGGPRRDVTGLSRRDGGARGAPVAQ
jgi:hypothetical protein